MRPLLPEPSILEKLNRFDGKAAEKIMAMAEDIGARRREEEKKLASSFLRACKREWKNFGISMILYPGPYNHTPPSPGIQKIYNDAVAENDANITRQAFAQVGDSLRLAISTYMTENDLSAEKIGLTETERDSLTLLDPGRTQKPRQAGFFRKFFP